MTWSQFKVGPRPPKYQRTPGWYGTATNGGKERNGGKTGQLRSAETREGLPHPREKLAGGAGGPRLFDKGFRPP